jgi:hypothetical protein
MEPLTSKIAFLSGKMNNGSPFLLSIKKEAYCYVLNVGATVNGAAS